MTYWGQTLEGAPSGTGRILNKDGAEYRGEFLNGLSHGFGVLDFPSADTFRRQRYLGSVREGQMVGEGKIKKIWTERWRDNAREKKEINREIRRDRMS